VLDCFSVSVEDQADNQAQTLADYIVEACRQRKLKFSAAAVALDCAGFMQHTVHSEFSDPKRIAATIRFDTEETLATDISEMAVAFRVTASGPDGANTDVFTAQRALLSDLILSLQSNGIDPMAVDPDVCCLARYLVTYDRTPRTPQQSTLHAVLSDSRGYLVVVRDTGDASILRTFLIGSGQERTGLLAREALVTTALAEPGRPVRQVNVFDEAGGVEAGALGARTGLKVGLCDLAAWAGPQPDGSADVRSAVGFVLACGAALGLTERTNSVSLRNDHMPYLGKKRRLQNAVRFLSISMTVLLLALGVYFHSQLIRVNKQRQDLQDKLETDYRAVMRGETRMPMPMKKAVANLANAVRRLQAEKQGTDTNQESVSAKLMLVLQGLNSCIGRTNLNISSITITGKSIVIVGDTPSRQNTQDAIKAIRETMKKAGIEVGPETQRTEGDRDAFTITAERAKPVKGR